MNSYFIFVIISVIVSGVSSTTNKTCETQSNTDCKSCLNIKGCAFCKNNKQCFLHDIISIHAPCSASDLQVQTCFANFQTLAIVAGSVGGVVLIAVIILIVCLCKRCKQRGLRKEQKQQSMFDQRVGERRAQAVVRSTERNQAADQIRMKYGLLKAKDDGTEYRKLS